MSVSPFDSAMLRDLFTDREVATLFTDTAELRAMLVVEGMLAKVQGAPADIGGYYRPNPEKLARIMRPSATLNNIIG